MRQTLFASIAPVLTIAVLSAGCTRTSDGTIEVAGFQEMTDLSSLQDDLRRLTDFSPLLSPARPRTAPSAAPAPAFPPAPPAPQRVASAAEEAKPRVRRVQRNRTAPAAAAPSRSTVAEAAPAAPPAGRLTLSVACDEPVQENGRYKVTCK